MSVVRARVESKGQGYQDFNNMLRAFRRACGAAKILPTLRQHEYYESPGRKARRKKRESEISRFKEKLKENFAEKKKDGEKTKRDEHEHGA